MRGGSIHWVGGNCADPECDGGEHESERGNTECQPDCAGLGFSGDPVYTSGQGEGCRCARNPFEPLQAVHDRADHHAEYVCVLFDDLSWAASDGLGPHLMSTADRISARLGYRRGAEL